MTPVDTLAEALAVTLRDTTLPDGRLLFVESPRTRSPGSRTRRHLLDSDATPRPD